jgi:hypothetical protein
MIKVIYGNSYLLETLQGERLKVAFNGRYLKKVFFKCLARSLSALQIMADTCIALRIKMADVYNALSHHAADEMGIVAIWFNYVCLIKCFQVHTS